MKGFIKLKMTCNLEMDRWIGVRVWARGSQRVQGGLLLGVRIEERGEWRAEWRSVSSGDARSSVRSKMESSHISLRHDTANI